MKIKCEVYRCSNKADTYLYLKTGMDLNDLPDGLHTLLGDLTKFLDLDLGQASSLARVKTADVLSSLEDSGYFLQIPPPDLPGSQAPISGYIQ